MKYVHENVNKKIYFEMGCLFKYKYICIQELPKYADRKYENTDANRDMKRMATH